MKIKLLPVVALTIGLVSCGSSEETSNDEDVIENEVVSTDSALTSTVDANDITMVSYVHGAMFSSQLKKQQLPFINPDDLVKAFATYKEEGLNNFDPKEAIVELTALAKATNNFATIQGADTEKAKEIFSKLYFEDIKQSPIADEMDFDKFEEGMLTFWKDEKFPSEDSIKAFSDYMRNAAKKAGEVYLAENAKRSEVKTTASGLQYEVLRDAEGPKPTAENKVLAHYEGTLINGNKFDSSYDRGEPIEFALNGVIPGWTEGLQLMSVGSKFKFYIPYNLGYGEQGTRGIPPFSTLVFVVELKDIK